MAFVGAPRKIKVRCRVRKDREVGYIAQCQSLDVLSQGNTKEEAVSNLTEALDLFVESCKERGVLVDVLKECGVWPESERPILHLEAPAPALAVGRTGGAYPAPSHSSSHPDLQISLLESY